MRYLSLFSGAGGGDLAAQHLFGWECIGYVEWEEYPCKVLEARIADGMLDDAPVWQVDLRWFNDRIAGIYAGLADVVIGGFPCQPFSVAGKQRGADDERNMWPATLDAIGRIRPRLACLENVSGLRCARRQAGDSAQKEASYFGRILSDLAEAGYDVRWDSVSAADVGAPHKRERLWIVAHRDGRRLEERSQLDSETEQDSSNGDSCGRHPRRCGYEGNMAYTARYVAGWEDERPVGKRIGASGECSWWDTDPADVGESDRETWGATRSTGETLDRPAPVERSGRSGSVREHLSNAECIDANDGGHGTGAIRGEQPESTDIRRGEELSEPASESLGPTGQSRQDAPEHTERVAQPGMGLLVDGLAGRLGESGAPRLFPHGGMETVPRTARRISNRVNRLKALGNGQVPLCAAVAWGSMIEEVELDLHS